MAKKRKVQERLKDLKIPLGIWIISIIYLLASFGSISIAIFSFLDEGIFSSLPGYNIPPEIADMAFIYFGFFMILLALFFLISAIGILFKRNWARYMLIAFCTINILGSVLSLVEKDYISAINLVFNLIIGLYLLFSKKVKKAFTRG